MNRWLALLRVLATMRRRPGIAVSDVARLPMRVTAGDLDTLGHMNNGEYLTLMDLGRLDFTRRTGLARAFARRGWYLVVASQTITYRRSLEPRQRYVLETALLGFTARDVVMEQRFVVDGQIVARGVVRGRFLKRGGGPVLMTEIGEATGLDPAEWPVPDWVQRWIADVALPSPRAEAPSVWPRERTERP